MSDESLKFPVYLDGTVGVDFPLPCFEDEGSLRSLLEKGKTPAEAFQDHALMFERCAELCRQMSSALGELSGDPLKIETDGYSIGVVAPATVIDALVGKGLLVRSPALEEIDRQGVKDTLQNILYAMLDPTVEKDELLPGGGGPCGFQILVERLEALGDPFKGVHPGFVKEALSEMIDQGSLILKEGVYQINPDFRMSEDDDLIFDWGAE